MSGIVCFGRWECIVSVLSTDETPSPTMYGLASCVHLGSTVSRMQNRSGRAWQEVIRQLLVIRDSCRGAFKLNSGKLISTLTYFSPCCRVP